MPEGLVFKETRQTGEFLLESFKVNGELPSKIGVQMAMKLSRRQLNERWDLALVFCDKLAYDDKVRNGSDYYDRVHSIIKKELGEDYETFEIVQGRGGAADQSKLK